MSESMRPTLTEAIYDMLWMGATLVPMAILSIPLALAILAALALWILPEAIGWHQSLAHILSELNRAGAPHTLFSIIKQLFVASWLFAFFAKLLVLPDEQNMVIQQRRFRENRRNTLRNNESGASAKKSGGPCSPA